MRSIQSLILVIGLIISQLALAQGEKNGGVAITDFYLQGGSFTERTSGGTLDDFRKLAPESNLLQNDFTEFSQYGGLSYSGNAKLSLALGLEFRNEEGENKLGSGVLRLGFTYFSGMSVYNDFYNENRFPVDTLVSSQTGEAVIVDSVSTENYRMEYLSDQLRLDGSLIFSTNREARFSLFAGLGLAAGLSLSSQTDVYYYSYESSEEFFDQPYSRGGEFRSERFRNKTNFGMMAYAPMGVDFRLGGRREFWKRLHLMFEIGPGVNITHIPEIGTLTNASFRTGFGLRVNINE